jgi:hypothetical protein
MKFISSHSKKIAFFLLLLMSVQLLTPTVSYALTSGPSQPEMQGFQPIGNSDMVDLFSGDFSYNIPLLDVGGYPVNLSYHSGASLDDESSWVGYGWSLNVGSVNRQLRGLPDDFNGTDEQEREMSMKDHITKGGKFSSTIDLLGFPVPSFKKKLKKKGKLNLSLTLSVGLKFDNYRGIGMELGANTGLSLTTYAAGTNTSQVGNDKAPASDSSKSSKSLGSIGLNLSSFDGASASINASILKQNIDQKDKTGISSSIGFGYNSRAGLTGMTLTNSMNTSKHSASRNFTINSSSISFNADSYTPTIDHPTKGNSFTFTLNLGPEIQIVLPAVGVTGFYSQQGIAETVRRLPSYGYLYSEKGKNDPYALMDVNREKDIPYSNSVKYLPIPVPSYDLFSATSQDGGGQYRAYRGSSGVFFDPKTETKNKDYTLGIEVGAGTYFDVGADLYYQTIKTKTQKWGARNYLLSKADFQASNIDPLYEQVYFKRVGESTPADKDYLNKIKGTSAFAGVLAKKISNAVEGAEISDKIRTASVKKEVANVLARNKREVRNTAFSYLTAKEAANHALDKFIKDYNPDSLVINDCNTGGIKNTISRTSTYRRGHHISEITITGDDGKRSVYGIPVYNTYQEEVSFSVPENLSKRDKGLINYNATDASVQNKNGRENYYSKEITRPYATSYLLTAILSPDYVDKTGNGITDDDLGTAVKFNYTKLNSLYKWRTPFAHGQDTANYNEGFLSDAMDDKANYVYGEKEVWYMHSIESKTMVAQFILGDRDDALGVLNSRGGVDTSMRLKYLKEIRLYSKSDLQQHGNNPALTTPIKVVHFVYNYSICRSLPNSLNNAGKLTLEKVYFTFAENNKGKLNPYRFSYDTSAYNVYDYRQYDRWGIFKDASKNPNGLNNSEYPYTLQGDTALANKFVSVGQLNKIMLPSGGTINVSYESDDYAYVQDKRASQMCLVKGVNTNGDTTGLINAQSIYVDLPVPVNASELKERYFENMDKLYFKFLLNLDAQGHNEFVPGYAQIKNVFPAEYDGTGKVKTVQIQLEKVDKKNPIAKAGWQFLRMSLPKYAYPGSDNLESQDNNLKKVIKALVAAFGSIKELIQGYDKRAERKGYSNNFVKGKAWVRLCSPEKKKLGGGLRVKRIDISDNWAEMSGVSGAKTATYSQLYDYTTKDEKGRTISSGVASYEPMVGNDENPFRQPVNYKQKQFLGLDNYFYIEEPFCESYFPAASVGYSKVSVKSIGTGDPETVNRTGITVSEFFTAKDYPTKVNVLGLDQKKPLSSKIFKLLGGVSYNVLGLSQGYSVELNDMHGKPKSENIYNKSGQNISSVLYYYKTANELAEKKELSNDVKVIDATGTVSDASIGLDVETYTDMRQETTDNLGLSAKISGGSGAILFFPLPFFFPGIGANYEKDSYRASSTIKIVNRFAIQYKVKKIQNGSSITTENLLWDAETGNVLLTKTQNEFDDPIYSFAYPAHWVYNGMAQAYRNLGTILTNFSTNNAGEITNGSYNSLLTPGDELIDVNSSDKYWVINSPINQVYQNRIIDENGNIQTLNGVTAKIIRSGRRNMANTAIATITSLNNPITGNQLDVSVLTKVLDAKATVFSEEWSMPVKVNCADKYNCSSGFTLSSDSTYCYRIDYRDVLDSIRSNFSGQLCEAVHPAYGDDGTLIYDSTVQSNGTGGHPTAINPTNTFWRNFTYDDINGPLNRTGVWPCNDNSGAASTAWQGFTVFLNIPANKTYYIGLSADNYVRLTINGTVKFQTSGQYTFSNWHIIPVRLLAGVNSLTLEGWNAGGPASFGAEVYDNTAAEIAAATGYNNLHLIFSTNDVKGRSFVPGANYVQSCPEGYDLDTTGEIARCTRYELSYPGLGINNVINPYQIGILGNWRAKSQHVYQVNRENLAGNQNQIGSTDIRRSGAYSDFNPFWSYFDMWYSNPNEDQRWVAANEVTYFNSKGTEIENKDALNRYSSALFGYLESLPVAVASNSRYREIAYDGFEDYNFSLDCFNTDTCNSGHFNFKNRMGASASLSSQYAHTGKYSLLLNGSVAVKKTVLPQNIPALINYDESGRYLLGSNELAKGFSPQLGKKYVLSFWVKDDQPRSASTNIQAVINGNSLVSNLSKWPVVEGWKRVEVPFILSTSAKDFILQLVPSGQVYIDDIRIHPYDGQMKSFAYDPSSQRLMAELDENNFATFYEYDDEGILVRVKKETERGIMTIKETRSSYKKSN